MPRIQSVSVCIARVPLDTVTSFATRTVSSRDYCLVKMRSTDGVDGLGFCYVGSAGGRIAQVAVEELLAPKLIGQDSPAASRNGNGLRPLRRATVSP